MYVQRLLEAIISMLLCPHKGRRHVHWHIEPVQKTRNKTKIHLQQCKSNIYLCKRENPFFHELRSRSSAGLFVFKRVKQFIFAQNLVHNSIFIFLLLLRFTYIHVSFRESFIAITGEKP